MTGSAGEEYGLMLLRGPEAVDQMRSIQSLADDRDDRLLEADLLSAGLEPFGEFPPDMQAFYRRAGIHPRHDEPVPFVPCKPPFRRSRTPGEAELLLLLKVFEAAVEADRRKLLAPAGLDGPEGICVVSRAGAEDPKVAVHRERLPRGPAPEDRFRRPRTP